MKRLIAMAALVSAAVAAQEAPPPQLQGLDNFTLDRTAPRRPDTAATPVPTPSAPVIALPSPTVASPRQRQPRATAPAPAPAPTPSAMPVARPMFRR